MKNPAHPAFIAPPSWDRRWFRDMLWKAFPGRSAREVATSAARALGVSRREVQHWLACEHDPRLRHVVAVTIILGAEFAFRSLEGRT